MKQMITINGKEHPFRYGFGALMLAEEVLGKPWGEVQNSRANFVMWYCCFLNADADFPYAFDEFVTCFDEDMGLIGRVKEVLDAQLKRWGKPKEDDSADKKKDGA